MLYYRLLRNNKESGPYTALQLQEMGLKPYDLLWTEGRGAAWQYASEIPELKAFAPVIEEQPFERFFKKEEQQNAAKETVAATKKTKPRFRISGDKIIMVEAGNMEVSTTGTIQPAAKTLLQKEPVAEKIAAQPEWQDMYEQWQPQPQKKATKKDEPVEVETKYSESLDDLKKRYAEKVLNEKKEKHSSPISASVKQNITAAIALIVLAVGGYVGYTLKQKDAAKSAGQPAVERADVTGDNSLTAQPADNNALANNNTPNSVVTSSSNKNIERSKEAVKTQKPLLQKPLPATIVKNTSESKTVTNTAIKKQEPSLQKQNLVTNKLGEKTVAANQTKVAATTPNNSTNKPAAQATTSLAKNNIGNTTATPIAPAVVKQNAPKKIDDYVSIKRMGGAANTVQNVRLQVNNNTDFAIDLAVIDVQYFDSKGKYQKGETMYVKNIDGGNNVEVRVPDSEKSSSIKYKVSLVSSEKKTLYLVGD